jgi:hypothetical protein
MPSLDLWDRFYLRQGIQIVPDLLGCPPQGILFVRIRHPVMIGNKIYQAMQPAFLVGRIGKGRASDALTGSPAGQLFLFVVEPILEAFPRGIWQAPKPDLTNCLNDLASRRVCRKGTRANDVAGSLFQLVLSIAD